MAMEMVAVGNKLIKSRYYCQLMKPLMAATPSLPCAIKLDLERCFRPSVRNLVNRHRGFISTWPKKWDPVALLGQFGENVR